MKRTILVLLFAFLFGSHAVHAQIDYNDTIQPIFNEYCTNCHGGLGNVTLSSYETVMSSIGANYDTLIVIPGKPDESPLVDVIASEQPEFGGRMPPGGELPAQDIENIIQWIEEGAHESVETSSEIIADLPDTYRLLGNYPNPFNPATTIQFEVPETSNYVISIYTVAGRLIRELQGVAQPGVKYVSVNMSRFPSGVYIYRIHFNGSRNNANALTGQMLLVK